MRRVPAWLCGNQRLLLSLYRWHSTEPLANFVCGMRQGLDWLCRILQAVPKWKRAQRKAYCLYPLCCGNGRLFWCVHQMPTWHDTKHGPCAVRELP